MAAHLIDVRRLAAADMYGTRGSPRRRKLIRTEFAIGAIGCTVLGVLVLASGTGWMVAVGVVLLGAGLNYVPLAIAAHSLSRPGALEAELSGVDLHRELRGAGVRQLWILIPLALVVSAAVRPPARPRGGPA